MKLITIYYDLFRVNKSGKKYHYVRPKPYAWLINDDTAKELAEIKTPAMTTVLTNLSDHKPCVLTGFVANITEATDSQIATHKPLAHDGFKPKFWHVNEEQCDRLNHLMAKIGAPVKFKA